MRKKLAGPLEGLGAGLAILRKRRGMTQAQVGERVGVSNTTVSKWEREESAVPSDKLNFFLAVLEASLQDLVDAVLVARREPPPPSDAERELEQLLDRALKEPMDSEISDEEEDLEVSQLIQKIALALVRQVRKQEKKSKPPRGRQPDSSSVDWTRPVGSDILGDGSP